MAKKSSSNLDLAEASRNLSAQFRGLDTRDPSGWPAIPRYFLLVVVAAAVVIFLWFVWLKTQDETLETNRANEIKLKSEFKTKVQKAVSLEALKKQREQVLQYVNVLEKQLPSKAEMDALLSDINQAGLGRSLQFELFRPGQVVVKDYYAELPIALKVSGQYHDIGSFAADIANLSRIVTLNNIAVAPPAATGKDSKPAGTLVLEATAKTFRYLDPEEIAAQRAAASKPGAKRR
ncbi:type 4a pilus biogenesis protein PilO [Ottowia sp.]|uniref:type 4a pilus biogenesis protein PilO n=1 Tax=Ottowia sp. TaxID=1898956 RepID=UPI003A8883EE